MPFPQKNRVKFKKNPLIEVASQLTFKKRLKEDELNIEIATELQSHVKKYFPLFNVAKNIQIQVNSESETVHHLEKNLYEYSTVDKKTKISLNDEFIAIVTTNYERWEKFLEDFQFFIIKFCELIGERDFSRIGLRYKDVIDRQELGLKNYSWPELIHPSLLAAFNDPDISESVLDQQSRLLLNLGEDCGQLSITHGTVRHQVTGDIAYMLDSDFFIEGDYRSERTYGYLERFNHKSRNFFQWSISEQLFSALEPENL